MTGEVEGVSPDVAGDDLPTQTAPAAPTGTPGLELLRSLPGLLPRLLDHLGEALFVVDAEQNVLFWNREAERLTGYPASEVIGRHCLAGIRCVNCLARCGLVDRDEIDGARVDLLARDGRTLRVIKRAFALRDPDGRRRGAVEILRDVTELDARIDQCRRQRDELAERDRLQSAVLGSIREGVLTIDPAFRITSFSRRAEELTGYRAEEVLGRTCREVLSSSLCESACPARHCAEECSAGESARAAQARGAGGVPLRLVEVAVPLRSEEGPGLGWVLLLEPRPPEADAAGEDDPAFAGMIGRSAPMRRIFRILEQVAATDVTVLLTGESGTGKEMAARALHLRSPRARGPFVVVNCAALPETLLESELFGHVRGAFTGALRDRTGRLEEAHGGVLFLDEVGEMPPALQSKLLRFLQEREFQRIGENRVRRADVRVVCATHRDLEREVAEGRFREDLYYRIRVVPVELPPLRDRPEDVPLLAVRLLARLAESRGRPDLSLAPQALDRLARHPWPGNVRELSNALEYAVAFAPGRRIRPDDLPPELSGARRRRTAGRLPPDQEATQLRQALERHDGNMSRTAAFLGMDRTTLYRKLRRLGTPPE